LFVIVIELFNDFDNSIESGLEIDTADAKLTESKIAVNKLNITK
jgi:hypothetical protein